MYLDRYTYTARLIAWMLMSAALRYGQKAARTPAQYLQAGGLGGRGESGAKDDGDVDISSYCY